MPKNQNDADHTSNPDNGECYPGCPGCNFDIVRMEKALAGPSYVAPQGLTRDELIAWFNGVADGTIIPELAPETGVDFNVQEMEEAFDCEFVEAPCSTPEEFRQWVMGDEFAKDERGPDDC